MLHHSEFALVDAMMPILSPAGRAGGARLRPARLGALALHRLLGRAEMRQGHDRGHRGRRRRPAPAEDRRRPPTSPCPRAASTSACTTRRSRRRRGCTTTSASPPRPSPARTASTAGSGATRRRQHRHRLLRQVLARHHARARPARPRRRRGRAARDHHLQGRHGLAARHGELPRVGARPRAHHRRRGEAQARRGADQGGDLRRPPRPPRHRLEERGGRDDLLGQAGARPGEDRPHPRHAARPRRRRDRGARRPPRACSTRRCAPTTPRRSRSASPGSARAARTTPRPACPRAPAPTPASAATTWCSGWTATPRASPTWAARAPTGSARRRSPTAPHIFQNLGDGTYNHSGVAGDPRRARRAASTSPTRSSSTTPSR